MPKQEQAELLDALRQLESCLKTHTAITTVFREDSEQEMCDFLRTAPEGVYTDAWASLVSNLNVLSSVNYAKDENDSTKNAVKCLAILENTIKKSGSFPKEVFQTDENKKLLISVALMINLFGVNCMIYPDISQLANLLEGA